MTEERNLPNKFYTSHDNNKNTERELELDNGSVRCSDGINQLQIQSKKTDINAESENVKMNKVKPQKRVIHEVQSDVIFGVFPIIHFIHFI